MRRVIISLLSVCILGGGCVTKSTHEQVQRELGQTRDELSQSQIQVESLEAALAEEESRVAALDEQVQILEKDASELRTQLASVVKDRSSLAASVAEMEQALEELRARRRDAENRSAEYRSLLARFRKMIDAGTLQVSIVHGRILLQLQTDVLFPTGRALLSDEGETAIVEVAKILATVENKNFQVEGHTDNVPIRTATYPSNWELAHARALRVVKAMIEAGMPPERISTAAFSEFRPTAPNDTDEGKAKNRRIEIVMLPDLSDIPTVDSAGGAAGPAS